jgi:HK97 family phage portal protein
MSARVFDLTARKYESRVLADFARAQPAGFESRVRDQVPAVAAENTTTANLTGEQLVAMLGLTATASSGVVVSPEVAMRVSAVYGCANLISGAVMTIPLPVYERVRLEDGTETRAPAKHDYWWMLNEQANEEMSAAAAWQWLVSSRVFHGDGFGRLLRPDFRSARIIGWEPLHPYNVQPFRDSSYRLWYRVVNKDGTVEVLPPEDMIHVPSLGFDGLTSPSPITYAAREAIGLSVAADRWAGKFFSDGATFDYALKTGAALKPDQVEMLRASLVSRNQTGGRGPLILTGGLEPAQLSVNPKDAEILATRLFSVEEICRILGVPPFMVGHNDKTTSWGSGIEQLSIAFVRYTLRNVLTLIAQEFNRKLWPNRERYFVEHDTTSLERGDMKSRFEAYRIGAGRAGEPGWMTPNEIRRAENMPPVEGGDKLNPGNGTPPAAPPANGNDGGNKP